MIACGKWRLVPLIFAAAVVLAACGATSSASTTASEGSRSSELTGEELQDYSTVLEAVQALRAGWLRVRTPLFLAPRTGTAPANPVWVYWDGTRVGDASYLGRVSTSQVSRVIRYDARAASVRWGVGHENGVIYVVPAVGSAGPVFRRVRRVRQGPPRRRAAVSTGAASQGRSSAHRDLHPRAIPSTRVD